ncbi:Flp pilus assembly protein CpaB [Massilia glaciei]|uniref:Flp pilus assembly protein CpaB n=1 Tax=Massilia glaciei TaxID=1524097 RepID=A0A2U2I5Z0_9BURK|nr:Flp pilus assembly protein CpaB [Massilia glaciei]PWF55187.1 Flp pilus assembly protein CpaB [Massilia glaciei]
MKNKRALIMMGVAVLLGLVAVLLASRWLITQSAANSSQIVVAATDATLGQRLTLDMLKLSDWPADNLPKGASTDMKAFDGRVLNASVQRGDPLSEAKLAPLGTLGGLSALITEGKRAITVRVNDVIGVAGFALPGNYVDIIVHTEREETAQDGNSGHRVDRHISKIVLERILVLAVAQEVSRDDTKPRVVNAVTLEVTPEQAEQLDLARGVGSLSLALRNQVDPNSTPTEGATKRSLLFEDKPAAPVVAVAAAPKPAPRARRAVVHKVAAPPQPQRECISVIAGTQISQECF